MIGQTYGVRWRPSTPVAERRLVAITRVGHEHLPAARELVDELSQLTAEAVRPQRAAPHS